MMMGRCNRLSHTLLAVLVLLTLGGNASAFREVQPISLDHRKAFDSQIIVAHGVDDVGPAFKNATEQALEKGKAILTRYSTVLRIAAIPTGIAVTFFGYFLLSPVLFLAGFVSGGGACFIAVNAALGDTTEAAAWIAIVAMLLGGAMLGFLALRALGIGMFAVGAALGVVLVSAMKTTLIVKAYPKDPQLAYIVACVICGLLFGSIALCLQKQMLIFSTAYAGSCGAVFGIGHFAGHFPTTEDLTKVETGELDGWVIFYIILTAGLGTMGMLFQFWLSKGKPMPSHAPHDRRRRRRRIRNYEPDDWSDDWSDDVYAERAPPSRRKNGTTQRPELPISMPNTDHTLKIEVSNARQESYAPSVPAPGDDVQNAENTCQDESLAKVSDHLYLAPLPTEMFNRRAIIQQRSPDIGDASEAENFFSKAHLHLAPTSTPLEGDVPDTSISIDDISRKHITPNSTEPLDFATDVAHATSPHLVNILLDSDVEGENDTARENWR